MTPEEVSEVLSDHYGFEEAAAGFIVPELIEARDTALKAAGMRKERAAAGDKAKAAAADEAPQEPASGVESPFPVAGPNHNPEDF